MTCGEFLARHSEYLDQELGADAAAEMRRHASRCARCARYDRVLRRGLQLLRQAEPVLPSCDSYVGLQQHLARSGGLAVAPGGAPGASVPRAPIAATVAVAGVVALVAWSALFRVTGVPATATAEVAPEQRALARPVLEGVDLAGLSLPVTGGGDWIRGLMPRAATGMPPTRPALLAPGPYTPLVVEQPDYGQPAVVSVLASYTR